MKKLVQVVVMVLCLATCLKSYSFEPPKTTMVKFNEYTIDPFFCNTTELKELILQIPKKIYVGFYLCYRLRLVRFDNLDYFYIYLIDGKTLDRNEDFFGYTTIAGYILLIQGDRGLFEKYFRRSTPNYPIQYPQYTKDSKCLNCTVDGINPPFWALCMIRGRLQLAGEFRDPYSIIAEDVLKSKSSSQE